MKRTLSILSASLLLLATTAWASPGAVDRYGCHKDPATGKRHCHGTTEQAKQTHVLVGALGTSSIWLYNDGPANLFGGIGGQLEFGWESLAAFGAYHYQWNLNGSKDFSLNGWDVGVKAGPNIAKLGLHPFALLGYYSFTLQTPGLPMPDSGLQYGAGLILNRPSNSFELKLIYKDPTELEQIWQTLGYPGVSANLSTQVGFHLRF